MTGLVFLLWSGFKVKALGWGLFLGTLTTVIIQFGLFMALALTGFPAMD
jgi:hypothetical protein